MKPWIAFVISCFAILLSLTAIGVTLPTVGELNFDYYGAIVGVLSFLITILMGYQIYTVINVKEELKEVRMLSSQIDAKLQKKGDALTKEYKDELSGAVPLIVALSSRNRDIIESEIFKTYKKCSSGQIAKELAWQSINMIIGEVSMKQGKERERAIEELSRNVKHDDIVEFYTDFARNTDNNKLVGMEQFILELIGNISNNDGDKK